MRSQANINTTTWTLRSGWSLWSAFSMLNLRNNSLNKGCNRHRSQPMTPRKCKHRNYRRWTMMSNRKSTWSHRSVLVKMTNWDTCRSMCITAWKSYSRNMTIDWETPSFGIMTRIRRSLMAKAVLATCTQNRVVSRVMKRARYLNRLNCWVIQPTLISWKWKLLMSDFKFILFQMVKI